MLAVLLVAAQAPDADAFRRTIDEFIERQPNPVVVPHDRPWVKEPSNDPRRRLLQLRLRPNPVDPKLTEEISRVSEALQKRHGENTQAMMADPQFKELQRLSDRLREQTRGSDAQFDRLNAEMERYDRETLRLLTAEGYTRVPSYRGRMVLVARLPARPGMQERGIHAWTLVEWTAPNRFYSRNLGRMLWTGGYRVTAMAEWLPTDSSGASIAFPPRVIDRPGKNFAQMHLGQEGWYVKFTPLRTGDFWIHLPTLSNLLRNLNHARTGQLSSQIGEGFAEQVSREISMSGEVVLGHPPRGPGKSRRGAVLCRHPDGREIKIAWEFAPG